MNEFIIRGTRGTIPTCGKEFQGYGGDTTCYSLKTDSGIIVFDAGTGLAHLASEIARMKEIPPITLFFTHFHMDHVIGLPCFEPLYDRSTRINILADPRRPDKWKKTLTTFMGKPYWPVGLGDTDAAMKLNDIPVNRDSMHVYGIRISWFRVPHPQQCLSFRIETADQVIVIATDVEYDHDNINPAFINFCRCADYLIYDAQYTPAEYLAHKGWGHSTWKTAAKIAACAGVESLILTHHAPSRTDSEIEAILKEARCSFARTDFARTNMKLKKKRKATTTL